MHPAIKRKNSIHDALLKDLCHYFIVVLISPDVSHISRIRLRPADKITDRTLDIFFRLYMSQNSNEKCRSAHPLNLILFPTEIPATTSGHLQLYALIMCNSGQHFAGNGELFPV